MVAAGFLAVGNQEIRALVRARDPGGSVGPTAGLTLDAGHGELCRVAGLRHREVVKLALGREEHVPFSLQAGSVVMRVEVSKHEEPLISALNDVRALGTRWTKDRGDGGLDRVDLIVDDGRVEVLAASRYRPRRVRVTVAPKKAAAGGAADEVS